MKWKLVKWNKNISKREKKFIEKEVKKLEPFFDEIIVFLKKLKSNMKEAGTPTLVLEVGESSGTYNFSEDTVKFYEIEINSFEDLDLTVHRFDCNYEKDEDIPTVCEIKKVR